jgi:hypothetical protein
MNLLKLCECRRIPYFDRIAIGEPNCWVACNCGKRTPSFETKEEALEHWNRFTYHTVLYVTRIIDGDFSPTSKLTDGKNWYIFLMHLDNYSLFLQEKNDVVLIDKIREAYEDDRNSFEYDGEKFEYQFGSLIDPGHKRYPIREGLYFLEV